VNKTLKILTLSSLLIVASSLQAESETWTGKPFSAIQVSFDKELPKKMIKSKVYISKLGVRLEGISNPDSGVPKLITVHRFKDDKSMMIDPVQKAYAVMGDQGEVTFEEELGSVMSPKPCDGYIKSNKVGSSTFEKRQVEKWNCTHPTEKVKTIQLYDPKFNVVIKEDRDGHITELRKMKAHQPKKSLFDTPKGYKKMSMMEMMIGYVKLDKYKEAK